MYSRILQRYHYYTIVRIVSGAENNEKIQKTSMRDNVGKNLLSSVPQVILEFVMNTSRETHTRRNEFLQKINRAQANKAPDAHAYVQFSQTNTHTLACQQCNNKNIKYTLLLL